MQLGLTEYLEHLGADPACSAILLYAESFGDTQRFRALARDVTAETDRGAASADAPRRAAMPRFVIPDRAR